MSESAYKQAGVDIDEAAKLVKSIRPHIDKTHRPGVMSGIGGFGAPFDLKKTGYKDPVLVSGTDGVGTKLKIAIEMNKHDTVGIDAVAMCVNDVVVQGAEPLFFLDYFATGKLVGTVAESVIAGIAEGCKQAGCALIGGETAEMPGMYAPGDYDLAGFTVGAVERADIITGERIRNGDVILGLPSSGLHSNGFSLVRKLIETTQGYGYDTRVEFEKERPLGELLLTPTKIYVKAVLEALKVRGHDSRPAIKGMAHITGGGLYENVPRILPDHVTADLDVKSWPLPAIFRWLSTIGRVSADDMAWTLNCGIGLVIICAPESESSIRLALEEAGETVYKVGQIRKRTAPDQPVILKNLEAAWT